MGAVCLDLRAAKRAMTQAPGGGAASTLIDLAHGDFALEGPWRRLKDEKIIQEHVSSSCTARTARPTFTYPSIQLAYRSCARLKCTKEARSR